jgi:hypothetical protein
MHPFAGLAARQAAGLQQGVAAARRLAGEPGNGGDRVEGGVDRAAM